MKKSLPLIAAALLAVLFTIQYAMADGPRLTVRFANPAWNGMAIPAGQQCSQLGGKGNTPALNVFDLPSGTAALQLEYNQRGGASLGVLRYSVAQGAASVQLPSVTGSQAALPGGFSWVSQSAAGGYQPPCTKGAGYYLVVKALDAGGKPLGEGRLELGKLQ
ncbi:hypothetical protein [Jeongeupia chitinilytica]|uniref:CHRD domain-containing protein n=1 Tax=Jeongeupia chitinilytica TaxID=1041641 RepID=A0ABQ3GX45_9NEIS|nr:hypothetical protein [Jeongeupia chitinilytica]GHD56638.1 hypothetical protein GCM10007350_04140 [Jeongeupia chitinilytica]